MTWEKKQADIYAISEIVGNWAETCYNMARRKCEE